MKTVDRSLHRYPVAFWAERSIPPLLDAESVHVWRVALDPPPHLAQRLATILAPDETARAARFHFERDRRRFTVGRAALRTLIGGYTGSDPRAIVFSYGANGKPALDDPATTLRFNLSNSDECALIAFAHARDVGVDVEHLRPMPDAEQIAEHFFSQNERVALRALAADQKSLGFFTCWTRKEAYIKAHGSGLALPLDQFDVTIEPRSPALLLETRGDPAEARRWSMCALPIDDEHVGALVVAGGTWRLQTWTWRSV